MTEICDEIRNMQQCLEVRAPTAFARRLGNIYPDSILYRITPNTKANSGDYWSWWDMDDLARAVVHRENVAVGGYGGWYIIPARYAPHLIAAFDVMEMLDRLEFMAVTGA